MSCLGWRFLSEGNGCAQSCVFPSLSPKSGKAAGYKSCRGWSFLRLLMGGKPSLRRESVSFLHFLSQKGFLCRSDALRAMHPTARLCSPILPQVPILRELPWPRGWARSKYGHAVTQSHGHPSMWVFELGMPAARAYNIQQLLPVPAAPSQVSLCPV